MTSSVSFTRALTILISTSCYINTTSEDYYRLGCDAVNFDRSVGRFRVTMITRLHGITSRRRMMVRVRSLLFWDVTLRMLVVIYPTFRSDLSVPLSRVKPSEKNSWAASSEPQISLEFRCLGLQCNFPYVCFVFLPVCTVATALKPVCKYRGSSWDAIWMRILIMKLPF